MVSAEQPTLVKLGSGYYLVVKSRHFDEILLAGIWCQQDHKLDN